MNTSLPIGHRDPRTEMVPGRYLYLAAQLITDAKQDLDYWNTVKVPQAPSDRLAFEELRQLAVFLPLVLVALAFVQFRFTGASIVFICVLPVMKALNDAMQRAITVKRNAWLRRDAGRYAFTHFMCKEFDLKPEDVTMKLVLKMCDDCKQWVTVATRLRLEAEEAERVRRSGPTLSATSDRPPVVDGAYKTQAAARSAVVALDDAAWVPESDAKWLINPATGLPMMDSLVDVHGNVFGMDNVDSLFNSTNYSDSFNTSFQGGVGLQQEGFNPGVSNLGGFGYD